MVALVPDRHPACRSGFFIDCRAFLIAGSVNRDEGHAHFSPSGIAPEAIAAYLHGECEAFDEGRVSLS